MTEAMPFLQKTILLSYDPRPFAGGYLFCDDNLRLRGFGRCNLRLIDAAAREGYTVTKRKEWNIWNPNAHIPQRAS